MRRQLLVASEPPTTDSNNARTINHYYADLNASSDFLLDVDFAIRGAEGYLFSRVEKYNQSVCSYRLAIVLDVDDTSLSHYPSFRDTNFANDPVTINARYHIANAPAIAPVLALYRNAIANDVAVFFVTARKPLEDNPTEDLRPYTARNLHAIGYEDYAGLYLAQGEDATLSTAEFKQKIRKMIENYGYRIVLNIGDQPADLAGGYAEQTYLLPNYLYPPTLPLTFRSLASGQYYSRTSDSKLEVTESSQNSISVARLGMFSGNNSNSILDENPPNNGADTMQARSSCLR